MCDQNRSAFDNIERNDHEPAGHTIGKFDYLNVSARQETAAVRALVDEWLLQYPNNERAEMIRRLRSRNDTLHSSAFFELCLHTLMLAQGFSIIAIEPKVENGRAPDFLVEDPNGIRFYLEATLATGRDDAANGADRRSREALQAIDNVESPDFFLNLHTMGVPVRPIAVGRLRRDVQRFVDGLDYHEAVRATAENLPNRNFWNHIEHGMSFRIEAVPKNTRRPGGRAIGGQMMPGGIIHPENAIRSAVEDKASRYGDLDLPLVIAVNSLENYARLPNAIDGLFGTETLICRDQGAARLGRNDDGAWYQRGRPVNARSSAVLFVRGLTAWSIAQRRVHLIINHWASRPLPNVPLFVDTHQVVEGQLTCNNGRSLAEIFDLREGWPE